MKKIEPITQPTKKVIFVDEKIKRAFKPSKVNKLLQKLKIDKEMDNMTELEHAKEFHVTVDNIDLSISYSFFGATILTMESIEEGIYQLVNNESMTYYDKGMEKKYYDDL